jgi:hypothetical protein
MDDFLSAVSFHPGHPFAILLCVVVALGFIALGPLALRHGSKFLRAG